MKRTSTFFPVDSPVKQDLCLTNAFFQVKKGNKTIKAGHACLHVRKNRMQGGVTACGDGGK